MNILLYILYRDEYIIAVVNGYKDYYYKAIITSEKFLMICIIQTFRNVLSWIYLDADLLAMTSFQLLFFAKYLTIPSTF
jgi:hypothetical protein